MKKEKEQICWTCKNACGGCSWSRNLTPVEGWKAEKTIRSAGIVPTERFSFLNAITGRRWPPLRDPREAPDPCRRCRAASGACLPIPPPRR